MIEHYKLECVGLERYELVLTDTGNGKTTSGVFDNPSRRAVDSDIKGMFKLRKCSFTKYSYSYPDDIRAASLRRISPYPPKIYSSAYK